MTQAMVWTIDGDIQEGKLDELRALLAGAVEHVKANEPGTLSYEFFVSEDGKRFDASERYEDSAAVLVHLEGFSKIAKAFVACVKITGMHLYGEPSDELRAAMADFHPTYWSSIGGFRR